MLRIVLRLVLLLLAVRVVYSIFNAGARRPRVGAPKPPPVVPESPERASSRLGGKIVDADFEDLPGEGTKT